MGESPASAVDLVTARVVELESLYAHQERTIGELNGVVLDQRREIESLKRQIDALRAELRGLAGSMPDERDPAAEKPPHY